MSLFLNQLNFSKKNLSLEVIKEIKKLLDEIEVAGENFSSEEEFNPAYKGRLIINFVTTLFFGLDLIKKVIDPKITSWFDVYDLFSDPCSLFIELNKRTAIFKSLGNLGGSPEMSVGDSVKALRGISFAESAEYLSKKFRWVKNHSYPSEVLSKNITLDIFDQISIILRNGKEQQASSKGTVYTPYYIAKQIAEKLILRWFDEEGNKLFGRNAYNKLKVFDPAVGTGIFLIATGNVIFENHVTQNLEHSSILIKKNILDNNLYGMDTDEIACYITRIKLLLWLIEEEPDVISSLKEIDMNINTGDSLMGYYQVPEELYNTEINKELLSTVFHSDFQEKLSIYQLPSYSFFHEVIELINREFSKFETQQSFEFFIIEGTIENWNEYKDNINEAIKSKVHFSSPDSYLDKEIHLYAVFKSRINDKAFIKARSMVLYSFEDFYNWYDPRKPSKFDIIIGNPPFIALTDLPMKTRLKLKILFPNVYTGNNDLSYFFLERMTSLLDKYGILGFILPKYFQTSVFARKIRSSLNESYTILELHDFVDIPIFSSTKIKTCFISLKKHKNINNQEFMYYQYLKRNLKLEKKFKFPQSKLNPEKWIILDSEQLELVNHIQSHSNHKLKDVAIISKGIETGCDKVFAPSNRFFFSKHLKLKLSDYKPWIKGKEIKQFFIEREGREVLYAPKFRQSEIERSQKILQYLNQNKKLLLNRSRVTKYYLWRNGDERNTIPWEGKKIVCPYKSKINTFAIDFEGSLSSKDVTWIIPKSKYAENEFMYVLLALLNSNVLIFYAQSVLKDLGCIYDFYPHQIKNFPLLIPETSSSNYRKLYEISKGLQSMKFSQERNTLKLEMNKIVYQLFSLNEDEINQIESNILI